MEEKENTPVEIKKPVTGIQVPLSQSELILICEGLGELKAKVSTNLLLKIDAALKQLQEEMKKK